MKFRFCGEGDCPDWVLAEIISTLSILNAKKFENLASLIAKKIIGEAFEEDLIKSLTSDVAADGKTAVACIHYLLINAARHGVVESVFVEEIQQLGLPKDHSAALGQVLTTNAKAIRQKLIDKSFKINELSDIKYIPAASTKDSNDCITLELKISQELVDGLPQNTTHTVNIELANAKAMLAELKEVRNMMEKYDLENVEKFEIV